MSEKKENFLKKAFKDIFKSAKEQHEVDKANLEAAKAEAKANFEYNRGTNSLNRAKESSKKSWDDAHMSPAERREKIRQEQERQIEEANERKRTAEQKYKESKVDRER